MIVDAEPFKGLHPLPFGQASATSFDDVRPCGDFLAHLPDAPSRFEALGSPSRFRIRLRPVALPDVTLLAGTSSPKATSHRSPRLALVIPFGNCATVLRTDGQTHRWASPHHAFFIPAGQSITAESTAGAFLRLDIVGSSLERAAAGMADTDEFAPGILDLAAAGPVAMQAAGTNWLPVIRALAGTVDAFGCDPARLVAAGFDDIVLRTVAMMLRPGLSAVLRPSGRRPRELDLDELLERIRANLAGRVTLSDMEAWSGRSARTIQLAFQKRFGVGPMQWLRDQRLDLVHARLRTASAGATVAQVAESCGIFRMATLTPAYARRFGERPSETLWRSRR